MKHTKHMLQKTQTDAFREFLELHSEVKIRERKFESLRPFFVKQAKERDRRSCLCRKHVEMQIVFKSCMKYRKELVKKSANIDESFVIKSVTEAAEKTLCPKPEGINYHNIKCLERECTECGVDNIDFLPEETSEEVTVSWSRYEYVSTGKFLTNGQEKKKIALVQKEAPPSELFGYFKELLVEYPRHSFMARWQREQLNSLLNPPPPHKYMLSVWTTTQRVMNADHKTKFSLSTLTLPRYLYTSPYCTAMLWKQLMVGRALKRIPPY